MIISTVFRKILFFADISILPCPANDSLIMISVDRVGIVEDTSFKNADISEGLGEAYPKEQSDILVIGESNDSTPSEMTFRVICFHSIKYIIVS